jgi:hypothetical protein
MLPLQLIGLISNALCALCRSHRFLQVFTFVVVTLYLFMVSLMLIGLAVLMIRSLQVGILCFLVLPLSHGNQWNNGRLLVHLTNTTRKLMNTNGNTERIFPSVNFRGILPMKIFSRYIPRELQSKKKLKQSKKNDDVSGFTNGITDGFCPSVFSRELHNCSLSNCTVNCCSLQTKSPTDWKVVDVIWRFSEKIQLI